MEMWREPLLMSVHQLPWLSQPGWNQVAQLAMDPQSTPLWPRLLLGPASVAAAWNPVALAHPYSLMTAPAKHVNAAVSGAASGIMSWLNEGGLKLNLPSLAVEAEQTRPPPPASLICRHAAVLHEGSFSSRPPLSHTLICNLAHGQSVWDGGCSPQIINPDRVLQHSAACQHHPDRNVPLER